MEGFPHLSLDGHEGIRMRDSLIDEGFPSDCIIHEGFPHPWWEEAKWEWVSAHNTIMEQVKCEYDQNKQSATISPHVDISIVNERNFTQEYLES